MRWLEQQLREIDNRSYPAYKGLKGGYHFQGYDFFIDHVQGDPFAAPSRVHVEVPLKMTGFPEELYDQPCKRIALQDQLTRIFAKEIDGFYGKAKGSGKSGMMGISRCGQEVLERTCLEIQKDRILIRFTMGFPANGRRINARELKKMIFEFVPKAVEHTLYYKNMDARLLKKATDLAQDQAEIRRLLKENGWVAFVANGAILPRATGVSDKPMKGAVAFQSPPQMEAEIVLPHCGKIKGMALKKGITLIIGGGYHGKSTLLKALEAGIYDHIAGDGREYVITENTAMKIRAEEGRMVSNLDITPFINALPNKKDTVHFFTEDASGSTSQAANVMEAIAAGSKTLLIDEDTSATNFMVRDQWMQQVIAREKEPITPFIEKAGSLYVDKDISTILVAGSSGVYFSIADQIIQMDEYKAYEITERVRELFPQRERDVSVWPEKERMVKYRPLECVKGQVKIKQYGKNSFSIGKETVDLQAVEQLADGEQLTALSYGLKKYLEYKGPEVSLEKKVKAIYATLEKEGFYALVSGKEIPVPMAKIRLQDLFACVNRYRGIKI